MHEAVDSGFVVSCTINSFRCSQHILWVNSRSIGSFIL